MFDEAGGGEASSASTREYTPLVQGAYCDTPSLYAAAATVYGSTGMTAAAESANSERSGVDARGPRAPSGSDNDAAVERRPPKQDLSIPLPS